MPNISQGLFTVTECIESVAIKSKRKKEAVKLLAVSKTFPSKFVYEAWEAGQRSFGENRVQEAIAKIRVVKSMIHARNGDVEKADMPEWHFIGRVQGNKTKLIAENFSWVHSVDSLRLAQRLSNARPKELPPINVCLQLNLEGELSKGGVSEDDIVLMSRALMKLSGIKYRGLMTIPKYEINSEKMRLKYRKMRGIFDDLQADYCPSLDTLSMGMSNDYEVAIEEGATIVRVGTAIFGKRKDDG